MRHYKDWLFFVVAGLAVVFMLWVLWQLWQQTNKH